jgi:hypothetical protein
MKIAGAALRHHRPDRANRATHSVTCADGVDADMDRAQGRYLAWPAAQFISSETGRTRNSKPTRGVQAGGALSLRRYSV